MSNYVHFILFELRSIGHKFAVLGSNHIYFSTTCTSTASKKKLYLLQGNKSRNLINFLLLHNQVIYRAQVCNEWIVFKKIMIHFWHFLTGF